MQKYLVKADGLLSRNRRIKMREIEVSMLTDVVERLCIAANEHLP